MKIKVFYIIFIILLVLVLYNIKKSKSSNIPQQTTRSFTGSRNHFVSMGAPMWVYEN